MTNHKIKVFLIDDHPMVRKGVRMMLACAEEIVIEAEADNASEALRMMPLLQVDVVLADIALPDGNGLDLIRQLKMIKPATAILMLSIYSEDVYAIRALKLGAAGYLTKNCPEATLVEAVRKVASGGRYISPTLADRFATMLVTGHTLPHEALSNRELEVMKLIASGASLVNIATNMHLSPSTVTTYRARILEKMGMKSNTDLAKYAISHGIII